MSNRRRPTLATAKANHAAGTTKAARAWNAGRPLDTIRLADATLWELGGTLCITPPLPEHLSPAGLAWIRRRVLANMLGSCQTCGALAKLHTPGGATITHNTGCDLADVPDELGGTTW